MDFIADIYIGGLRPIGDFSLGFFCRFLRSTVNLGQVTRVWKYSSPFNLFYCEWNYWFLNTPIMCIYIKCSAFHVFRCENSTNAVYLSCDYKGFS